MVLSTQHKDGIDIDTLMRPDLIEHVIKPVLPEGLYDPEFKKTKLYVNPTGKFVIGGPMGDTGLTGRKIIVDTYGGFGRHGGGAFSGKDPSKVDRSAAYAARYVAKNVVAAGLADRCEVADRLRHRRGPSGQRHGGVLRHRAGRPGDSSRNWCSSHFDLRPAAIIRDLRLLRPIYEKTAAYGHFGREDADFTWESTDKAEALRRRRGSRPSLAGRRGRRAGAERGRGRAGGA